MAFASLFGFVPAASEARLLNLDRPVFKGVLLVQVWDSKSLDDRSLLPFLLRVLPVAELVTLRLHLSRVVPRCPESDCSLRQLVASLLGSLRLRARLPPLTHRVVQLARSVEVTPVMKKESLRLVTQSDWLLLYITRRF